MSEPTSEAFIEQFGARPVCANEARSSLPLTGEWRYGHGVLCCGTLRIARSDFDTNPSPEFQQEVFDWICDTLNSAVKASGGRP